jgi:uncharacterized cofD-like protein
VTHAVLTLPMTLPDRPDASAPQPAETYRVVAIGGGTGLSALLHGLKRYAPRRPGSDRGAEQHPGPLVDITAVVTVTDDGGSSGRLRREFSVLPPGDIRNCMVALSEDEALLSRLFQYRFPRGRGLKGHSFGNLFLTALTDITGDFPQAVRVSSDVLAIAGRIYPSTTQNVTLVARLADGTRVEGETRISRSRSRIRRISLRPRRVKPLPETLQAIAEADLITLGPGSLFTSVIPNLLVEGIPEALRASPAVKAYFVNLMWQPGETMHFTAADHVEAIYRHAGEGWLDYVIVNTRPVSEELRARYARRRAQPVEIDFDRLERLGVKVLARDLLQEGDKVRHDPAATAQVALELAAEGRRRASGKR